MSVEQGALHAAASSATPASLSSSPSYPNQSSRTNTASPSSSSTFSSPSVTTTAMTSSSSNQNHPSSSSSSSSGRRSPKVVNCRWDDCTLTYSDPEDLYHHLCNDHVGRKSTNNLCLTCKWEACEVSCAKRDHITSHLRVHTPLKPHSCESCGKTFKRPQDLKKHERIHTEAHQQEQQQRQVVRSQAAAAQSNAAHAAAVAAAAAAASAAAAAAAQAQGHHHHQASSAGGGYYHPAHSAAYASAAAAASGASLHPHMYAHVHSNANTSANGDVVYPESLYTNSASRSHHASSSNNTYSSLVQPQYNTVVKSNSGSFPSAHSGGAPAGSAAGGGAAAAASTDPNSYSYLAHGSSSSSMLGKRERESAAAIGDFMADVQRRRMNPTYDHDMAARLSSAFAAHLSSTSGPAVDQTTLNAILAAMETISGGGNGGGGPVYGQQQQQAEQMRMHQQQQQQQEQLQQHHHQEQLAAAAAAAAAASGAPPLKPQDLAQMNAFLLQLGANAAKSLDQDSLLHKAHHPHPHHQQQQQQQHTVPSNTGSNTSVASNGASPSPSNYSMDSYHSSNGGSSGGGASTGSSSSSSSASSDSMHRHDSPFGFTSLHEAGLTGIPGFDDAIFDTSLPWASDTGAAAAAAGSSGTHLYPPVPPFDNKRPIAALPARANHQQQGQSYMPASHPFGLSVHPADLSISAVAPSSSSSSLYPSLQSPSASAAAAAFAFDSLRTSHRGAPVVPQLAPVDMSQANYIKVESLTRAAPLRHSRAASYGAMRSSTTKHADSAVRDVKTDSDDEMEDVQEPVSRKQPMGISSLLSGAPGPVRESSRIASASPPPSSSYNLRMTRQQSETPSEISSSSSSSSSASSEFARKTPSRSQTLDLITDDVARIDGLGRRSHARRDSVDTVRGDDDASSPLTPVAGAELPPVAGEPAAVSADVRLAHINLIKHLLIALNFPERAAQLAHEKDKEANTLPPLRNLNASSEDDADMEEDEDSEARSAYSASERRSSSGGSYPTLPSIASLTSQKPTVATSPPRQRLPAISALLAEVDSSPRR